jgi:crossover junction endodeoxyribonuclease RuvC
MNYIGIDPGKSGAAVFMDETGQILDKLKFSGATDHDIAETIWEWRSTNEGGFKAMIEKVHAMPKQGVSSTFKFGYSYGFLTGVITTLRIPFETVAPHKWQGAMQCRSKGDKNVTKAAAQRLYPDEKVIHATADAILIAEYCRRTNST